MSESHELTPEVPFTLDELAGIERVLWGYGQYVQKSPASAQNAQRVASLEQIRERLALQLASGDVEGVQVFLSLKDMQELREAMLAFATLVKRWFPQNEERDSVIESVNMWRLRLMGMRHEQ